MSYQHIHYQGPYPPPGYPAAGAGAPGAYPSAEPRSSGYLGEGYPPAPAGYQGYFNDNYNYANPQHIQHQHYDDSIGSSFIKTCLATLCCCCLLEECCGF